MARAVLCLVADGEVIDRFGGAVRFLQIGLLDEPLDTILIVPRHPRASSIIAGPVAVEEYRTDARFFGRWERRRLIGAVERRVSSFRHDGPVVVHALSGASAGLATAISGALGGQVVITLSSRGELDDPMLPEAARRAAGLIVPSRMIAEQVRRTSFSDRPLEIVPIGVVSGTSATAFRRPGRAPSLVYVGPLDEEGGCEALLRAAKHVLRQRSELRVFLVGKGRAEGSLRQLARVLNIDSQVTFTGRLEHWRSALRAADIYCVPKSLSAMREEPLQALASGLVVIAAEGSVYDDLVDRQTALLFPEDDVTAMADRIREVLDDRTLARRIAATAQSCMREGHSVGRMVSDHVRVYRRIAAERQVLRHPAAS